MRTFYILIFFNFHFFSTSQSLNLNETYAIDFLRTQQLIGNLRNNISFSIQPLSIDYQTNELLGFFKDQKSKKIFFRFLPIDFNSEFSSRHPYNRNNGSMIPSKGYQHLISLGWFLKLGPLEIQLKPEQVYAENKSFEGFWAGHYPIILSRRIAHWNNIDIPERFGQTSFKKTYLGQSSIKFKLNKVSIGYSNENIWWGPSIRNSIMLSNHAKSFEHITFNSNSPLNTSFGTFEFQLITGKLTGSNYKQSYTDFKYANFLTYNSKPDEWRFFQGFNLVFSPKIVPGLSLGFIRWIQAYKSFIEKNKDYFPVFDNLLRINDKYGVSSDSLEGERDQAAGLFFRWVLQESKAEIYSEFYYNDSKANFRDLLLDSDHSRAFSIGFQKVFNFIDENNFLKIFGEWTQMEQSASRSLRNAGSWYTHYKVYHGFTNRGEVLGSGIGPGSNSYYFGISKQKSNNNFGLFIEIVENDNDFLYEAFKEAKDFRRYWKDYNLHITYKKIHKKIWTKFNLVYSRSLNYQWGLDDSYKGEGYDWYRPGIDINNFHLSLKLIIPISLN